MESACARSGGSETRESVLNSLVLAALIVHDSWTRVMHLCADCQCAATLHAVKSCSRTTFLFAATCTPDTIQTTLQPPLCTAHILQCARTADVTSHNKPCASHSTPSAADAATTTSQCMHSMHP